MGPAGFVNNLIEFFCLNGAIFYFKDIPLAGVEDSGALILNFPRNLVVVGGMYMPMHQNRGMVLVQQLHQRVKTPVGRILVVAKACRGRVSHHDVHAAHALELPAEL